MVIEIKEVTHSPNNKSAQWFLDQRPFEVHPKESNNTGWEKIVNSESELPRLQREKGTW